MHKWIEQQTCGKDGKQQQRGSKQSRIEEASFPCVCICACMYDIDLTDKSFHARVNPQKTSKEKYDNKTSFHSLL